MQTLQHKGRGARLIAMAVALRARIGEFDQTNAGLALTAVIETHGESHPLARALADFLSRAAILRRNPDLLDSAGAELLLAIRRDSWPEPRARADIDG